MDDLKIIQTLAGFVGWTDVHYHGGHGEGFFGTNPGGHKNFHCTHFLDSYDLIAIVAKKFHQTEGVSPTCGALDVKNWWDAEARDHAEALAMAILKIQEHEV